MLAKLYSVNNCSHNDNIIWFGHTVKALSVAFWQSAALKPQVTIFEQESSAEELSANDSTG